MTAPRFTIFVLLRTLPSWLALPRARRGEISAAAFADALMGGRVMLRYFDAEAFTTVCTDVSVFEADDLFAFYGVIERLRDTVFFTQPYFEIVHIIPTIENGFRHFEQSAA